MQDSIDIHIFEEAAFLNLNTIAGCKFQKMLLTAGTQLKIKTNRDSLAKKINYKILHDDFGNHSSSLMTNLNYCSNKTIQLYDNGVLNIANEAGYCSIILNIQIEEFFKHTQSLIYFIKIRPIHYLITDFLSNVSFSQNEVNLPNGELTLKII